MRTQKPWYRKSRDAWFVEIHGKQVLLAKGKDNEDDAYREFYRRMAVSEGTLPQQNNLKVANICDLFLAHAEKRNKPKTFAWYQKYLQSFCDLYGKVGALDVKPIHVTTWLDNHPKWKTSARCAVIALKRAYNWCEEQGLISVNPMKKVKKPAAVRRERILLLEEREQIFKAIRDQEFRDFVYALQETGCRPGEVARVTAANVDLKSGVWEFAEHKTSEKTGKPRVVYLTPGMIELTTKLMVEFPEGPLFRGPKRKGRKAYTRNAIRCRFRRLRKKLPNLKGVCAYTFRHSYITDALERGVSVASVAELAGHADLRMIQEHYGHLSQKKQHLQEAARKAVGCVSVPSAQVRIAQPDTAA